MSKQGPRQQDKQVDEAASIIDDDGRSSPRRNDPDLTQNMDDDPKVPVSRLNAFLSEDHEAEEENTVQPEIIPRKEVITQDDAKSTGEQMNAEELKNREEEADQEIGEDQEDL